MPSNRSRRGLLALVVMLSLAVSAHAQAGKDDKKSASTDATARLRIEVTGGDAKKPVPQASVYVKWLEDRKLRKDKTLELNLKTNEEGIANSPEIPQGKTLVQIIAPGWKTYGMWFDVNQSEQTIPIHLVRPASN